jgi:outer membrane immunogenic protein
VKSILLATALLLALGQTALAQEADTGDVTANYFWERSNTTPGNCGCFGMNGGALSASAKLSNSLAGLVEISGEHASNVLSSGKSLTVTTYQAGVRYQLPPSWNPEAHRIQPFAEAMMGAAHAGGGIAGTADGTFAFASTLGGGVDVPLNSKFSLRAVQVDYQLTLFKNFSTGTQNNFRVGAGVVYRW